MTDYPSYAQLNRERDAPRKKAWAQANRERINAANKRWREKNKDTLRTKQQDYQKRRYYLNKLKQRFEVLKGEILIGNDSQDLLDEFIELIEEMHRCELIDEEEIDELHSIVDSLRLLEPSSTRN